MTNKKCLICEKEMLHSERYPNMICPRMCWTDINQRWRNIKFYNKGHNGGFISIVNNNQCEIHECYINNHKCYADETRFGGIVVQLSK